MALAFAPYVLGYASAPSMSLPLCLPYHVGSDALCSRFRSCSSPRLYRLFLSPSARFGVCSWRALHLPSLTLRSRWQETPATLWTTATSQYLVWCQMCPTHRTATYQRRIEYIRTLTISIQFICDLYLPHDQSLSPSTISRPLLPHMLFSNRRTWYRLYRPTFLAVSGAAWEPTQPKRPHRGRETKAHTSRPGYPALSLLGFARYRHLDRMSPSYCRATESTSLVCSRCGACGQKVISSYIHSSCFSLASKYEVATPFTVELVLRGVPGYLDYARIIVEPSRVQPPLQLFQDASQLHRPYP